MILALDPSSSRTGYAILSDDGKYVDAGSVTPDRRRDAANDRIRRMVADVAEIIVEHHVTKIVIEDTSGKVGRAHGGAGAGLAIHGKAVGWMIAACERLVPGGVEAVLENEWTRGVAKERRAAMTRMKYPETKDSTDLDALDALGLADWWLAKRRAA